MTKLLAHLCLTATFVFSFVTATQVQADDSASVDEFDLFVGGEFGYSGFRIPSIIQTQSGELIAFCEGRKNGLGDAGDIDLVQRRSSDLGKTWTPLEVVWDDAQNTVGNPCPVVDASTGRISLLLTWNRGDIAESKIKPGFGEDSRRVFVLHSTDNAKTWSKPTEITQDVKLSDWTWYATGPGAGIQLKKGEHQGRLVIPCDHKVIVNGKESFRSHVICSDDSGTSWKLGGVAPEDAVNECEVAELSDGRLMLNMRSYKPGARVRQVALSNDGGASFQDQRIDPTLIDPVCQASLRRYAWQSDTYPKGVLLFSNAAHEKSRVNMTIRASQDDGETWFASKVLYPDSSAYSCLCVLNDQTIMCLYERDKYSKITLASFKLDWLMAK